MPQAPCPWVPVYCDEARGSRRRARLESHDHGILCTVHAERGVDAVPVAYAVDDDGYVGVPIDRVKPKASLRLQRERNLEADPRATLLVEHWDRSDWSRLWWVRAELRWQGDTAAGRAAALASRLAVGATRSTRTSPSLGPGAADRRPGRLGRRRPLIPGQWERSLGTSAGFVAAVPGLASGLALAVRFARWYSQTRRPA